MENSILISTKKILGLAQDYEAFDIDVITHINAVFGIVNQMGIGSVPVIVVDNNNSWDDWGIPDDQKNLLKTYTYLKVRMLFDPPATSFQIEAMNNQIAEMETRLSYMREVALGPPPTSEDQMEAIREEIFEEVLHEEWG